MKRKQNTERYKPLTESDDTSLMWGAVYATQKIMNAASCIEKNKMERAKDFLLDARKNIYHMLDLIEFLRIKPNETTNTPDSRQKREA